MSRDASDPRPKNGPWRRVWARLGWGGGLPTGASAAAHTRLEQYLAFSKAVGQVMEHTDQESILLESLCTLAVECTPVTLAWVCRVEPDNSLQSLADAGDTAYLDSFAERRSGLPADHGPLFRVWQEQQPLFNEPFSEGPLRKAWQQNTRPYQLRSMAVLPIHRDHQPWALLVLYDRDQRGFPQDCQVVLEGIARRVSEALEDWIDILRERVAREHQLLLGTALQATEEGVVLTDADRRILYVNASFSRMTGYTLAEISRFGLHHLQGPRTDPRTLTEIDEALCGQGFFNGRLLNYRRDGQTFWNHLSIIPIYQRTGAISHYVGIQRDVTAEWLAREQLEYEACHDRLTGLGNRRALMDQVAVTLPRVQRGHDALAICMIDLDHFKPINDLYGHEAGDHVLRVVGRRLHAALRRSDYVARLGGDEFVLLIEGFNNFEELEMILVKIEVVINEPIHLKSGAVVGVRLSMGVCLSNSVYADDFETLLRYADQALYRAKANKRQRTRYWELCVMEENANETTRKSSSADPVSVNRSDADEN
ncbi:MULTISPECIES: diguanylate cyclase [Acidithiobacillus]|uniref:Sensor domain-containing diguanylate cyclase n=3 Tax=Acidithiobacillus TaxID=119977 RepID=A0A5P9XUF5_ACITH|nr:MULTISPECIES: diguanylate cyclase [Acidithiobacillus]MBU2743138.1 diguanylate cyclase [Acidithiobacillus albertensis]QFX96973.1 sensor domain-containing diguanylate cyclase [Acidithiobacillus thiooxidans ATCC 19377]